MSKIKIHHTAGNISYYYTEKMKEDGLVFSQITFENDEGQWCTDLDLVDVKEDNATVYLLLQNANYKQIIEVYMMVKLIADQYGTDDFYDFVSDVSSGSMGSAMQSSEKSEKQIYEWLFERFEDFLEEVEQDELETMTEEKLKELLKEVSSMSFEEGMLHIESQFPEDIYTNEIYDDDGVYNFDFGFDEDYDLSITFTTNYIDGEEEYTVNYDEGYWNIHGEQFLEEIESQEGIK